MSAGPTAVARATSGPASLARPLDRTDLAVAGAVAVAALAARLFAAALIPFPVPEDTAYYVDVARNLVAGRGLVADALWSYQTPPLVFPRPAFEVWLPLPSLLAAVPLALTGGAYAAAQLVAVGAGVAVALLAWHLALDVARELALPAGRTRVLAAGTGLAAAVYLPLVLHSALPDSTMLFAALALGAAGLMTRLLAEPRCFRPADRRLLGLGGLLGLAALTRNEAIWLALTWLILVLGRAGLRPLERVRGVGVVAVVAVIVFAPWAIRDWLVFGTPLPGQALANALSVTGFDIFSWSDRPTLERYLAVGPARLIELRLVGLGHNLLNVLVLLGVPTAVVGLLALPTTARVRALRPLLLYSAITFAVTSLVFPVATTWGTFLHAAGPVHVLLLVAALVGLDRLLAAIGRRRGWTRPVAWLGPTLAVGASLLFSVVFLPGFGAQAAAREREFRAIEAAFAALGTPLGSGAGESGPVVTNFPIWLAYATDAPALALPDEPPAAVLDLAAAFPGTRYLVVLGDEHGRWPGVLESDGGETGAEACFRPLDLAAALPAEADALADVRAWEMTCLEGGGR
jgi:hypothetical protein